MTGRNADIQPESAYVEAQNSAANFHVQKLDYGGSYEALAIKMAFVMGSNTAEHSSLERLLVAVLAGREWAKQEATQGERS